jgi:hypothetical protein
MELNHQKRRCGPFRFLFGFRANRNVTLINASYDSSRSTSSYSSERRTDTEEEAYVPAYSFVLQS